VTGTRRGAFFLDVNSSSPGAKRRAAQRINTAGGRYVEGAVMTSVPPYRIKVPLLLGGPDANALLPLINAIGFDAKMASDELGIASATKLCRSVMIKGLEAMVIESLTTARFHGVEDAVIASLRETFPGIDWERQAVLLPARDRARTAPQRRDARGGADRARSGPHGLECRRHRRCQAWVADQADAGVFGARDDERFASSADWRVEADRILGRRPRRADGRRPRVRRRRAAPPQRLRCRSAAARRPRSPRPSSLR
jgi:hypothetical protein